MTVETVQAVPAPGHLASRLGRGRPRTSATVRVATALAVLALLAWQLGSGPFVDGLRATSPWAVLAALIVTAGTTWCCALRWSLVSARVGEKVTLRTAYAAYYRSQLVNATVPGGVVGDVHRAVRHGWRGVVWERGLGQLVQVSVVGSLLLPGGWRWVGLAVVALVAVAGGAVLLLSALAVAGHLLVFVVAATSVGVELAPLQLLPIGALVLLGSAIPLNVAGWGPREGVAAWAFAAFGSTAAVGLTVSVTYGVLAMVATLPGLLVLEPSTGWRRRG
jgi:glycosyltransferase 2 family protein